MSCRICNKVREVGRAVAGAVAMRKAARGARRRGLADMVNEKRQAPVSRHSPEGFDEVLEGRDEA